MDFRDLRCVSRTVTIPEVLYAYSAGLFPMGVGHGGTDPMGWWSPSKRGVMLPGQLHVSKSLRKSVKKFTFTWDTHFAEVVAKCANPTRPGAWITPAMTKIYRELHALGVAHSVEVWRESDLVGGLFGIAMGAFFAGESMFHESTDASKAALVELVRHMDAQFGDSWLIDTQWQTEHLATMGVSEMPTPDYMQRLELALQDIVVQDFLKQ